MESRLEVGLLQSACRTLAFCRPVQRSTVFEGVGIYWGLAVAFVPSRFALIRLVSLALVCVLIDLHPACYFLWKVNTLQGAAWWASTVWTPTCQEPTDQEPEPNQPFGKLFTHLFPLWGQLPPWLVEVWVVVGIYFFHLVYAQHKVGSTTHPKSNLIIGQESWTPQDAGLHLQVVPSLCQMRLEAFEALTGCKAPAIT